jgi:PAS domain S-box-containing protein
MFAIDFLEKVKGKIINAWLAEVTAACQIEDKAACRKFFADYYSLILDNLANFNPKSLNYLRRSLNRGFLSNYSLEQIFEFHLSLKRVLNEFLNDDHIGQQAVANPEQQLLIIFQQIDALFLKILNLFGSQFHLLLNYYRHRYTTLAENISEIVYSISPRGNFTYISSSIKNSLAVAPGKLKTIDDLIKLMPQADRENYLREFAYQIENKTELKTDVWLINKRNKRTRYFINHSLPDVDTFGNLISIEGILFDITDLKEIEGKCRKLMETAGDAIFIADAETEIILDVNKKAEELLGIPAKEIIGMHQTQLHPKEEAERYAKIFREHAQFEKTKLEDISVVHKDGRKIPVEISASVTEFGGKKIIQSIFRDVTERKRAEKALQKAHDELEMRVRERTAELAKANQELQIEIKERKRAEEELRKFKFLSDNSSDAHFLSGRDAKFQYVNKTACEMMGYSEKELLTLRVPDVDVVYDVKKYQELFDLIQEKTVPPIESMNKRKDGSVFPSEITVTGYKIDGKSYMFAALRDITERKRVEEELRKARDELEKRVEQRTAELTEANKKLQVEIAERKQAEEVLTESEEKYRGVVDNIGIGVALINPNMEILSMNKQMCEWFPGIDVSQRLICYKVFNDPPRENICSYCPTHKTLKDGQIHESITNTPRGDEIVNYRMISSPLKDKAGNIIAAIEVVENITERKRSEEALKQSEEFYRTLIETAGRAGEGILLVSYEGDVPRNIFANKEICRITGYSEKELLKIDLRQLFAAGAFPKMMEIYKRRRARAEGFSSYDVTLLHKDGHEVFVALRSAPALFKDMSCSVVFMRDITERKRLEQEMEKKTKEIGLLKTVTQTINQTRSIDELLGKVLAEVKESLNLHQVGVYLLDENQKKITLKKQIGLPQKLMLAVKEVNLDQNPISRLAVEGRKTVVVELEDVQDINQAMKARFLKDGVKEVIMIPLMAENKVLGLMYANSRQTGCFDKWEQEFLGLIGCQIGTALDKMCLSDWECGTKCK